MAKTMIEAVGVTKSFGSVTALQGIDLSVAEGSIHGLLGHNGAGKTTLVHILSTLLPPTSGSAKVCGFDVTAQPKQVRKRIGLTGQFASVDVALSGRDNLGLIARLLGASRKQARGRTDELLELFDLTEAAKRPAAQYSGGMRRRLDIAASLVGRPEVIFLDEPTTGLDPTARLSVWETIERLAGAGAAVLLTTQYLDEADRLCDRITVLSEGAIVAGGAPAELKAEVGQRMVTVTLRAETDVPSALNAVALVGLRGRHESGAAVSVPVATSGDLAIVVRALNDAGTEVAELAFSEPTLDDVYLAQTRRPATQAA
ncbi:ATP-binding cassette domain-containing protein [Amycolatopsis sp. H20-H5]|uniref:ATP-binding cassette domain-containing protein n=1 Tax=Amycolatopsis sp. H20-H5 TaxID=3046309 RepID=UPI002DBF8999|nr:ATP-binding cassette domain-containing protein [Amycolatopsis sp. H20-H5]MEC3979498.1 ATP-binding cassette domain-containing protein [Amycolatopsis sp. H20-H5]